MADGLARHDVDIDCLDLGEPILQDQNHVGLLERRHSLSHWRRLSHLRQALLFEHALQQKLLARIEICLQILLLAILHFLGVLGQEQEHELILVHRHLLRDLLCFAARKINLALYVVLLSMLGPLIDLAVVLASVCR